MGQSIPHLTTLSKVLENLRLKKQDNEFVFNGEGFTCCNGKVYTPDELVIVKVYRFEGQSDPADNAVLYLIEASDGRIGYSIDSYGPYSNTPDGYDDFLKKIRVDERMDIA
jgi:hypothetical protein